MVKFKNSFLGMMYAAVAVGNILPNIAFAADEPFTMGRYAERVQASKGVERLIWDPSGMDIDPKSDEMIFETLPSVMFFSARKKYGFSDDELNKALVAAANFIQSDDVTNYLLFPQVQYPELYTRRVRFADSYFLMPIDSYGQFLDRIKTIRVPREEKAELVFSRADKGPNIELLPQNIVWSNMKPISDQSIQFWGLQDFEQYLNIVGEESKKLREFVRRQYTLVSAGSEVGVFENGGLDYKTSVLEHSAVAQIGQRRELKIAAEQQLDGLNASIRKLTDLGIRMTSNVVSKDRNWNLTVEKLLFLKSLLLAEKDENFIFGVRSDKLLRKAFWFSEPIYTEIILNLFLKKLNASHFDPDKVPPRLRFLLAYYAYMRPKSIGRDLYVFLRAMAMNEHEYPVTRIFAAAVCVKLEDQLGSVADAGFFAPRMLDSLPGKSTLESLRGNYISPLFERHFNQFFIWSQIENADPIPGKFTKPKFPGDFAGVVPQAGDVMLPNRFDIRIEYLDTRLSGAKVVIEKALGSLDSAAVQPAVSAESCAEMIQNVQSLHNVHIDNVNADDGEKESAADPNASGKPAESSNLITIDFSRPKK